VSWPNAIASRPSQGTPLPRVPPQARRGRTPVALSAEEEARDVRTPSHQP
jgi:hypothetical protein